VTDVADIQGGTTPEGIHLGAMAGTVDVLQRCYTGIELRHDVLWLAPRLPKPVRRLRLFVRYRCRSLTLELEKNMIRVKVMDGARGPVRIGVSGQTYEMAAPESRCFELR
jgi:trehalose/maltose hydrolase-like predicted phosphorylase